MTKRKHLLKAAACAAAILLTAAMPLQVPNSAYPGTALSAQAAIENSPFTEIEEGALHFAKYEDHAAVISCKSGVSSVEIPASIGGVPVTYIDDYAFEGSDISEVTIPSSVTKIGHWAFAMCNELRSFTIPDSIEYIGIRAFEYCPNLETVEFPDHLVKVSSCAFNKTPWLAAQREKGPLVIINGDLIDGATYSGDLVIPSEVKYISPSAFAEDGDLTSVVIPASVESISDNAFWKCTNLTSCEIRGAEKIEMMAFAYCDNLKDLKVSNKLKTIELYGFSDCTGNGATITFYGNESQWNSVVKDDLNSGDFLKNARVVLEEGAEFPTDEPPEPQNVEGDVDGDGELTSADLVALQKWLLAIPGTTLKNNEAADMDKNDIVDIFDLGLLKHALLNK